jgi:hypothetical protein
MDRLELPEFAREARARADALALGRATSAAARHQLPDTIAKARARTAVLRPQDLDFERRRPIDPR